MDAPALAPELADSIGYYEATCEICARAEADRAGLSDDEIIVLSVVAAQLALAKYVEPGPRDTDATLNKMLAVLDHRDMLAAMSRKMSRMLEQSEHREQVTSEKKRISNA